MGSAKNRSHDREGHEAKLTLGRAVKQERLETGRTMKQRRVQFGRTVAPPPCAVNIERSLMGPVLDSSAALSCLPTPYRIAGEHSDWL